MVAAQRGCGLTGGEAHCPYRLRYHSELLPFRWGEDRNIEESYFRFLKTHAAVFRQKAKCSAKGVCFHCRNKFFSRSIVLASERSFSLPVTHYF